MSDDKSPLFQRFGKSRLDDRKLDQLLGICEGVIADGTVNQAEAQFLQSWLVKNADIAEKWPANVMLARIDKMLADGVLDDDEQGELVKLLMDLARRRRLQLCRCAIPLLIWSLWGVVSCSLVSLPRALAKSVKQWWLLWVAQLPRT